jgi:hypothetical protein
MMLPQPELLDELLKIVHTPLHGISVTSPAPSLDLPPKPTEKEFNLCYWDHWP